MNRELWAGLAATILLSSGVLAEGKQLLNLEARPAKPRFKVTERVWPGEHGQTDVCLWADDKLATVTFSVDDNICSEHPWWLEMGRKYDFRCTWFVIVHPYMYKYDGSKGENQGFFGSLATFQRVFDAGHEVQPHGTTTINSLSREEYEKDLKFAQDTLRKIPGNPAIVYAYPGGDSKGFHREVVAKYCIGARGTVGGVNIVNRTDYLDLRTGTASAETLSQMLDDPKSRYYRGWLSHFTHGVAITTKDPATRKTLYDDFEGNFKRVNERRDDLWVTTYREAFLYGQSRDTARLTPGAVTAEEIRFTLSDDMKDEVYTYPLTVKVRVDGSWDAVKATQAGKEVVAQFVLHDEDKFLLVKARPDGGEVVLLKTAPTVCLPPAVLTPGGRHRDRVEVRVASPTSGAAIRYTMDGTAPGPGSPLYEKPVVIARDAAVEFKAACFREGLEASPAVSTTYEVWLDRVPPRLLAADAVAGTGIVALTFSEQLAGAPAEKPAHYRLGGVTIEKAELLADGRTVVLRTSPVPGGKSLPMTVTGAADLSGNAVAQEKPLSVRPSNRSMDEGLLAHWRFAESVNASYALDSCGALPPGLAAGTPQRAATEKGASFVFDGKTTIQMPAGNYGLDKANAFTVSLWARFDGALKGQLVQKGKYSVPFGIHGYVHRQAFQIYARAGKDFRTILPGKIERGAWYHVALTVGEGKLAMYKNGEPVVTEDLEVRVRCPREPMFLGRGFTGKIADLRLYGRALSPDEVARLAGRK